MFGLRRRQPGVQAIALTVGGVYYAASFIVFRSVLFGLPAILDGQAVVVGDELVPFFNTQSQLFDQARGDFSPLTNGYEFRVRYSFLTTWLRHHKVLPFAILVGIPTIFWAAYLTTAWFVSRVFSGLTEVSVYLAASFPTALIYAIMVYAKITHFYTLIFGLYLMMAAILFLLYGLLFARRRWWSYILWACALTLFNPAVHYLVLFSLFFALAGMTLAVGEFARWVRRGGGLRRLWSSRTVPKRIATSPYRWRLLRYFISRGASTVLGRGVFSAVLFVTFTVVPYALFVKFVALRGVENLSETVPGDYYFIRDASVSWLHILSWDLAGIMDKILFGDYLAKTPRAPNVLYSILIVLPMAAPFLRRRLTPTRAHRQLLGVVYVAVVFAAWATIGYAEPSWFPTFHRSMAMVTRTMHSTDSTAGDLTLSITSTIVQVLRFPHRFQLILFAVAPMLMTLPLALSLDTITSFLLGRAERNRNSDNKRRISTSLIFKCIVTFWVASVFFGPFLINEPYREVYGSGNFGDFLEPVDLGPIEEIRQQLNQLPSGKTVVLPPTETAKLVTDTNGTNHKYIDKFYIYYLDKPSYYYGLTGDAGNKFEFFLILRGMYYQQDWWINPARDIGIKYLVVNKGVRDNGGVGAEYLPNVESYVGPAIERQDDYVDLLYENEGFALYELTDQPPVDRPTLLVNSSWDDYLSLVYQRLDLSACYNFEYLPYFDPDDVSANEPWYVYTDDQASAAVDQYALDNEAFFVPSSKIFAFDSDVVASSYYLSPMFRLFLFFSNTKWNRTEMITPGIFGTLRGSFVGVPRPTQVTIPITTDKPGQYRVLLRGAATANLIEASANEFNYHVDVELRSPEDAVALYDSDEVYQSDRQPISATDLTVEDLERRIGDDLVPLNVAYDYHDLGVVDIDVAGSSTITIDKQDANPLLVEGLVLVPENEYQEVALPDPANVVSDPTELDCGTTYDVFGEGSQGYVDPAANAAHEDLTNEELLSVAASGVEDLSPPTGGGLGGRWTILFTLTVLMAASLAAVRSRMSPEIESRSDQRYNGSSEEVDV